MSVHLYWVSVQTFSRTTSAAIDQGTTEKRAFPQHHPLGPMGRAELMRFGQGRRSGLLPGHRLTRGSSCLRLEPGVSTPRKEQSELWVQASGRNEGSSWSWGTKKFGGGGGSGSTSMPCKKSSPDVARTSPNSVASMKTCAFERKLTLCDQKRLPSFFLLSFLLVLVKLG